MARVILADTDVTVRLGGGRRANLRAGALVPDTADTADVARLLDEGYLVEYELPDEAGEPVGEVTETPAVVYCADCAAADREIAMVEDTDFGGYLCPVCEPEDVALLGDEDARRTRYVTSLGEVSANPTVVVPPPAAPAETGPVDVAALLKGSVEQVLDAVGDNADLAVTVLAAEQAASRPRKGVLEGLQEAIDAANGGA